MAKQNNQQNTIEQINAQYGKLPPQAIDVEEAVLGALMLEPDAYFKVSGILNTDSFYKIDHQIIFDVISEMASRSQPIDLRTITQRLKDTNKLEEVGGPVFITRLTSKVASAAHIEHHARIIFDKYFQREIIRVCSQLQEEAYNDDSEQLDMMWAMLSQRIDDLMAGSSGMMHIKQVLDLTTTDLEQRQVKIKNNDIPGVPTGLADLNRINAGWQKSELVVVAARPAMGKTAIALHFTKSAAQREKHVCVFSLEMENIRLSQRLIISNGGLSREHFKRREMTTDDWTAYNRSRDELSRLPIYIDDTPSPSVKYIESVVRTMVRKGQCDLVVIDYLQLVDSPQGYGNKNREREVAEISRALKKLTKMVPVILLAQLNRGIENREDKTPRLADLRESGAIEQDADIVIFPWRPAYYDIEEVEGVNMEGVMFLEIAKYRDGSTDRLLCKHNEDLTKFYDWNTYDQAESAPY